MYSTSAEYKTAIRAASRPYDTVYGTITFTDSTTMTVDSSNMPSNAISISKQCIDGGELMFGGVFSSVLKLSVITDKSRYAFYGATVELFYKIQTGTTTEGTSVIPVFETIPLGVFVVTDADRPTNQVNLTAYDNMTLLDRDLGGAYIVGDAWTVFQQVEEQTGYELAFEEDYLSNFVNSTAQYQLSASEDNGIKTYRDVVKEVCQQLGCFALDDRTGKLALKRFKRTIEPADATLSYADWYSMIPADYECKYIALSITSLAGTFVKTTDTVDAVGNVMNIEDAPAWDYGSDEALQAKTDNLYAYLSNIEYTPVDLDMPGDPSFDCGDKLILTPKKGGSFSTIITSYEWKFHQGMTITSEGVNPYLSGNTALATESSRILNQAVEKSRLQFVSFTNSRAVTVGDNSTAKVGEVVFTPTANTNALFVATLLVDISVADTEETYTEEVEVPVKAYDEEQEETVITDINGNPVTLSGTATNTTIYKRDGKCGVEIYYMLGPSAGGSATKVPNDEYPYIAKETLENGKHIITLTYPISNLTAYEGIEWSIYITARGGTISMAARSMQATIFGQEINVLERFDGKLDISQELAFTNLGYIVANNFTDASSVAINDGVIYNISEIIALVNVASITAISLTDTLTIYMENDSFITEEGDDFVTEDNNNLLLEDN